MLMTHIHYNNLSLISSQSSLVFMLLFKFFDNFFKNLDYCNCTEW